MGKNDIVNMREADAWVEAYKGMPI